MALANDTGVLQDDSITNDPTLALGGIDGGATVQYRVNASSDSDPWSTSYTPVGLGGDHRVEVRQIDLAGNVSAVGQVNFTLDQTAPTVLTVDPVAGDDTISTDEAMGDVTISGSSDGKTVEVTLGSAGPVMTEVVGNTWQVTIDADDLPFGPTAELRVVTMDIAGNTRDIVRTIGVETTAPLATVVMTGAGNYVDLIAATLMADGQVESHSETHLALLSPDGDLRLELTGTGLAWNTDEGGPVATAGTYTAFTFYHHPGTTEILRLTGVEVDAVALDAAVGQDADRLVGDWPALWALTGGYAYDVTGSADDDLFQGRDHADRLVMGAGDDTIFGSSGDDTIDGGDGWDEVTYGELDGPGILADLDLGTVTATDGSFTDTLTGVELLRGTQSADTLLGGAGDDLFSGLGGGDLIDGRGGIDRVSYFRDADYSTGTGVFVDLATETATDGFGQTDTLRGIEEVVGTNFADTIIGDAGHNWIEPLRGGDSLDGGAGYDWLSY